MHLQRLLRCPYVVRTGRRWSSSSSQRNVGIVAHVDAGKTTTTERMLYYSGLTSSMGDVDKGNTVTDFMEQERERGITITSASVAFLWKGTQVNLIDTPGHVDFTMEVERALRVLDAAVILIDAAAGVEAQTLTVWRQALNHRVPAMLFINKMDKSSADLDLSLKSVKHRLGAEPLLLQLPLHDSQGKLEGVIDLVDNCTLIWDLKDQEGNVIVKGNIEDLTAQTRNKSLKARQDLIDRLSLLDNSLAEHLLEKEDYELVDPSVLKKALRRATLTSSRDNKRLLPTLVGSAFKKIGVQPLLNAVVDYLPSPNDRKHAFLRYYGNSLCALAFKIVLHPRKGLLTFVRLYSGSIKEKSSVFNMNVDQSEKVDHLYVAFADELKAVAEVHAGNIAVIAGLKSTSTGDTLVHNQTTAKSMRADYKKETIDTEPSKKLGNSEDNEEEDSPWLAGITVPESVFHCSIEAAAPRFQNALDKALTLMTREDPSLKVSLNKDTNQTVLSGMGELHLEVVFDRLRKEHKVEAEAGKLMIAYKEAPLLRAKTVYNMRRSLFDRTHEVNIDIEVQHDPALTKSTLQLSKEKDKAEELGMIRPHHWKSLLRGFEDGISIGPTLGYPVIQSGFVLHSFNVSGGCPETLIASAMAEACQQLLKKEADCRLLEPIMLLEILVDGSDVLGQVTKDLQRRRGTIISTEDRGNDVFRQLLIVAEAPLAELRGYAKHLRASTHGRAFLGMEVNRYQVMEAREQKKVIQETMHTFEVLTGLDARPRTEVALTIMMSVRNGSELRKLVMGQGEKAEVFKDVVLVKANMILDVLQLKVALQKALVLRSQGRLTTRSVATETLYFLSPSKSIRDALTTFGVDKDDSSLIAIALPSEREGAEVRLHRVIECIEGEEVKDLKTLRGNVDLTKIKKLHKIEEDISEHELVSVLVSRSAAKELL